jgi:hypothetical protein
MNFKVIKRLTVLCIVFFISCEKNMIKDEDVVKLKLTDLYGKYVINYDVFVSTYYNNLPNSLKNFTDTFQLKLSNDNLKLEWRSLTLHKALEFDAESKYLPLESTGYQIAKIPFFNDHVKYKGVYDTITTGKNWNLYNVNNKDEFAYFVLKDGKIALTGSMLENDPTKSHLKTSTNKDDSNEWRLKFRIKSCVKIE